MAGLGRRTHYRKHLTDAVLFDLPEPNADNERIAKVVATRGSNQFDVKLATHENSSSSGSGGETVLAILPTKFRKLVWVKRNDYVIVQCAEVSGDDDNVDTNEDKKESSNDSGGIRFMITHILYKDQIQHLTSKGLWPTHDPEFASYQAGPALGQDQEGDGIVYNEEGDSDDEDDNHDDQLFVNTNRIAKIALEDSSSEEGED